MLRVLVSAVLVLSVTSALPLRAPARGPILSSCLKPEGLPRGRLPERLPSGSRLGFAGFSEAMAKYDGSKSDKSGSTCAPHGENGLDRAAPKALATSPAATALRQLYKDYGADGLYADTFDSETEAKAELDWNKYQAGGVHALHAIEQVSYVQSETMVPLQGTIKHAAIATDGRVTAESACTGKPSYSCVLSLEQTAEGCSGETIGSCPLAGSANKPAGIGVLDVASAEQAPSNTTEGGVDEEEAAEGYRGRASRWLFQFLAISIGIVLGLFVFGRVIPRCSSSAKGAAWRSYVVAYLLISPEIALVAAAATSVRGSDYTITKSSKIKTQLCNTPLSFDFIEIGTSSFDTLLQQSPVEQRGLSVDPLQVYLNRLPNRTMKTKVNAAIGNASGTVRVYYVDPSDIELHKLPFWFQGCNMVGTPHLGAMERLKSYGLPQLMRSMLVPSMTLLQLFDRYCVKDVAFFKVDTEGFDTVIMKDFVKLLARGRIGKPKQVLYEANYLNEQKLAEMHRINKVLVKCGYSHSAALDAGGTILQQGEFRSCHKKKENGVLVTHCWNQYFTLQP